MIRVQVRDEDASDICEFQRGLVQPRQSAICSIEYCQSRKRTCKESYQLTPNVIAKVDGQGRAISADDRPASCLSAVYSCEVRIVCGPLHVPSCCQSSDEVFRVGEPYKVDSHWG